MALADVAEDFAGAAEHKHPKIRLDSLKLLQVGLGIVRLQASSHIDHCTASAYGCGLHAAACLCIQIPASALCIALSYGAAGALIEHLTLF